MKGCGRWFRRVVALGATVGLTTVGTLWLGAPVWAQPSSGYTFTAVWQGQSVNLTNVPNVSVEQLPDATLVGQVSNFQTNEPSTGTPPFYCLDGESLNVWTAPNEFPGDYVVHNGDQGSQCTYGTWTFPQSAPAATAGGQAVTVPAAQRWVDTGITLSAGEQVSITVTGTINDGSIYPQNATSGPAGLGMVSADGYSCTSNVQNPQSEPYLVAGVPCESLVGYVGDVPPPAPPLSSPTAFLVGPSDTFVALQSGKLYLSVNDNHFADNSGQFTATVAVSAFPGIALQVGSTAGYAAGAPVTAPTAPVILDGRTMVPIRFLSQLLGARVDWDAATRQVIIESPSGVVCFGGACRIIMTVGSTTYDVNGTTHRMDVPPTIVGAGYTVVPIRFVAQAFGLQVHWDPSLQEVLISSPSSTPAGSAAGGGSGG